MNIISVTNPVFGNQEHTTIICTVKFDGLPNPVPFHATSTDTEAHGKQLYKDLMAGKYGPIMPWIPNIAVLSKALIVQCDNVCVSITNQISPSANKTQIYQNALSMVSATGAAPTVTPMSQTFATYASVFGLSVDAFVAFVLTTSSQNAILMAAHTALTNSVNASKSVADLNKALTTFNNVLSNVETAMAPVFVPPLSFTSPSTIKIKGLNV